MQRQDDLQLCNERGIIDDQNASHHMLYTVARRYKDDKSTLRKCHNEVISM